jgi:hypothetical protein
MSEVLPRRIKSSVTKKIIEMHDKGYVLDFRVSEGPRIVCLQDNVAYNQEWVYIKVIDQFFDRISRQFQYIHTIETTCGRKGLLLDQRLFTSFQMNDYDVPEL